MTDQNFVILTLLRTHKYEDDNTLVAVGQTYPFKSSAKLLPGVDDNLIQKAITDSQDDQQVKQVIQDTVNLGTILIEHAMLRAKIQPNIQKKNFGWNFFFFFSAKPVVLFLISVVHSFFHSRYEFFPHIVSVFEGGRSYFQIKRNSKGFDFATFFSLAIYYF